MSSVLIVTTYTSCTDDINDDPPRADDLKTHCTLIILSPHTMLCTATAYANQGLERLGKNVTKNPICPYQTRPGCAPVHTMVRGMVGGCTMLRGRVNHTLWVCVPYFVGVCTTLCRCVHHISWACLLETGYKFLELTNCSVGLSG